MATPRQLGNLGDAVGGTAASNANFDSGAFFVDASNNRVGVNTTSPDASLTVSGTANVSSAIISGGTITTLAAQLAVGTGQNEEKRLRLQNANRDVYFYLSNTTVGLWDASGATGRWTTDTSGNFTATGNITAYSDIKLKANIHPIQNALNTVSRLRGVSYQRISDGSTQIGVVAQEVKEVLPEVVIEDSEGTLSVAYGNMVGLLIEAIKEMNKRLDTLKAEVTQLKGE